MTMTGYALQLQESPLMDHQIHLCLAATITKNADSITVQSGTVQIRIKTFHGKHMDTFPMIIIVRVVRTP